MESDGYTVSSDPARFDVAAIHAYLTRSYWAEGIQLETVERSVRNSMGFAAFDREGRQVGFARVITDRATYAYLCDVYVLEEHRGHGLGKRLMDAVLAHPELADLRRFTLATRDAHGLYEQLGFSRSRPGIDMEIRRYPAEIYRDVSEQPD